MKEHWDQGLIHYSNGNHEKAVMYFEKSISEFNRYQKVVAACFGDCKNITGIVINTCNYINVKENFYRDSPEQ